jgi:hypothetical protein
MQVIFYLPWATITIAAFWVLTTGRLITSLEEMHSNFQFIYTRITMVNYFRKALSGGSGY